MTSTRSIATNAAAATRTQETAPDLAAGATPGEPTPAAQGFTPDWSARLGEAAAAYAAGDAAAPAAAGQQAPLGASPAEMRRLFDGAFGGPNRQTTKGAEAQTHPFRNPSRRFPQTEVDALWQALVRRGDDGRQPSHIERFVAENKPKQPTPAEKSAWAAKAADVMEFLCRVTEPPSRLDPRQKRDFEAAADALRRSVTELKDRSRAGDNPALDAAYKRLENAHRQLKERTQRTPAETID